MVFRMITPQEVLDINRSIVIEQYIDRELKKCNFDIELNQFKEILNPDDVDLLIEKYKDVGWEIENISYFLSFHNLFAEWSNIELFFKIPEEVKNNGK